MRFVNQDTVMPGDEVYHLDDLTKKLTRGIVVEVKRSSQFGRTTVNVSWMNEKGGEGWFVASILLSEIVK